MAATAEAAAATQVRLSGASRVTGQEVGDLTREVQAIDAHVRTLLAEINQCFAPAVAAGTAAPGTVSVRYVILPHGGIERAEVVQSSVGSADVEGCIAARVGRWRFRSSGEIDAGWALPDTLAPGAQPAPRPASGPVVVLSTFEFREGEAGQ